MKSRPTFFIVFVGDALLTMYLWELTDYRLALAATFMSGFALGCYVWTGIVEDYQKLVGEMLAALKGEPE